MTQKKNNTNITTEEMLHTIAQAIHDKKGFNIVAIDVKNISSMTDYFIIAEGSVERHVKALETEITDQLSEKGFSPLHTDGLETGDWIVLDYGNILVHLFKPDLREKYSLEKLWRDGQIVDLNLK